MTSSLFFIAAAMLAGCGGGSADETGSAAIADVAIGTETVDGPDTAAGASSGLLSDSSGASNSTARVGTDGDPEGPITSTSDPNDSSAAAVESEATDSITTTPESTSSTQPSQSTSSTQSISSTQPSQSSPSTNPAPTVGPPTKVSVVLDGPDVVISWAPPESSSPDVEFRTHMRPVGDNFDFWPFKLRHRNHERVYRLSDVPHGTYAVEVWAVRVERVGEDKTIVAESTKVIREITVDETAPIVFKSLTVSDVLYDESTDWHYMQLSFEANKCVFLEVTGATGLRYPDYLANNCFSSFRNELELLAPGTHTITVTATDRAGRSKTETTSFVVGDSQRQPCVLAEPPPDPWRVKVGTEASLELKLSGDCGQVDWRYQSWEEQHPGFSLDDGVITAKPAGPPRGELISVEAVPALSEIFGIRVNVIVCTDDNVDVEP